MKIFPLRTLPLAAQSLALFTMLAVGVSLFAQEERPRQRPGGDPFGRFFTLPGVEFSAEQEAQVEKLRKEMTPQLEANQNKWNSVMTAEQRQAQREAFQAAREAKKDLREARQAVEAAVKLTDAQRQQQADIQQERNELRAKIVESLMALLTDEQRSKVRRDRRAGEQPQTPPTHANVKYGPHARNVMDVWLAKSDKPTPVLISIHGGGFRAGQKSVSGRMLAPCLEHGVSVIAITYRFSSDAIAPASFLDCARAVQFVRSRAKEWNLDPTRIASTGSSAGAGLSLWLGFHDDLADPDSDDPVQRESTRLTCMMVSAGQSSYDPRFIRDLFPGTDTYKHSALAQLYDVDLDKLDDLPQEKYRLFEECSPLHHLSKGDAPAMLSYGGGADQEVTDANIGIHHAKFGIVLKEKMDALGIRCIVNEGGRGGAGRSVSAFEFMMEEFDKAK